MKMETPLFHKSKKEGKIKKKLELLKIRKNKALNNQSNKVLQEKTNKDKKKKHNKNLQRRMNQNNRKNLKNPKTVTKFNNLYLQGPSKPE